LLKVLGDTIDASVGEERVQVPFDMLAPESKFSPDGLCRLKEYIKEQLIDIRPMTPVHPVAPTPAPGMPALTGPAAVLAGLI
jgi:hypothetical protein